MSENLTGKGSHFRAKAKGPGLLTEYGSSATENWKGALQLLLRDQTSQLSSIDL